MKKILIIVICVATIAVSSATIYYLLVLVPRMNAARLAFDKQKQTGEIQEKAKERCLSIKNSSSSSNINPLLSDYRKANMNC